MIRCSSRSIPTFLVLLAVTFAACDTSPAPVAYDTNDASDAGYEPPDVQGRYIVVLDAASIAGKTPREAVEFVAGEHAVAPEFRYTAAITGFAARLSQSQLAGLESDPRVDFVEPDGLVHVSPMASDSIGVDGGDSGGSEDASAWAGQKLPWGVARVGGGITYSGTNRAWVIDSGIDLDHPDLNVDVARSRSFLTGKQAANPNDQNGHGTHVAGTIAAIDNGFGVVGVAAGAPVVAVRVLDRGGWGTKSSVIGGIDYVAANAAPGDVANLSLGGPYSRALNQAVKVAATNLLRFTLAAGNSATDASTQSPASANGEGILTVSAFGKGDVFASFSNYGNPPVDLSAPGVSVWSTFKGGRYANLDGTSMAAPHVAGLLLLGALNTDGFVSGDPDGTPDPVAVH